MRITAAAALGGSATFRILTAANPILTMPAVHDKALTDRRAEPDL